MKLALIGDPVDHSRSQLLHRGFLREAQIDGDYDLIRVPRGNGIDVVRRMRMDDYTGANVTSPLKEEVLPACDILTDVAQRIGAVNTLFFAMRIIGTNTDGIGAREALEALLEEPIALKRIGVLGTGASARAILTELHDHDAYAFVWGRSLELVATCCANYEAQGWPQDSPPEIILSTLPPHIKLPEELLAQLELADIVMDVNYGERATLHRQLAREVIAGDAMLEAQARASFDFWLSHLDGVGSDA